MAKKTSEEHNKEAKKAPNFLKFSGLAFEMLGFILLGVWGGYKLDQWLVMKYPVFTACLSLLGVVTSLIYLIRKLPKY